ncbi:MAG: hypothetical protein HOI80_00890 [Alphaproteobacteria bacterium]|nr:hypothetical protein [Alphaproteobacteria bacterium]
MAKKIHPLRSAWRNDAPSKVPARPVDGTNGLQAPLLILTKLKGSYALAKKHETQGTTRTRLI